MTGRRRTCGTLGAAGEQAAAAWYRAAGYEVLDRNWRRRELGELDLVVGQGRTIVFCEVKTRRGTTFGAPVDAVTWRKQLRLRALAAEWLAQHRAGRRDVRFDVASVRPTASGELVVDVLEAAF